MRSISSTLLTQQKTGGGTPYVYLLFTSKDGLTTYDYSSDQAGRRILLIDHREEPYQDEALIVLRNNDRSIPDLRGYWTEPGYGYVTGAGNEHSQTPRLWVKHQQDFSAGGQLWVMLELEGMWARLRETLMQVGSPPYYDAEDAYSGMTPYEIMENIIENGMSWTLNALTEDDGIIDTFIPVLDVNVAQYYESVLSLIYRVLNMTKSYLRPEQSLAFTVKFPNSGDSIDESYYSFQTHYFYEYLLRTNVLIPNHVYVYANQDSETGEWSDIIAGEAKNQTEIDRYADVIDIELAPTIDNETDADNRAAAILTRANAERSSGKLLVPHDSRVQLYDNVAVYDERGL